MNHSNLQIVREYIKKIMPEIEHPPSGKILYPWLSLTHGEHYASIIFTWDYHHAALRFAIAGQPEYLMFLVDNLLIYQQPDGLTPNVIHVDRGPNLLPYLRPDRPPGE